MYSPTLLLSDTAHVESCLIWILRVSELQQLNISVLICNKEMGSSANVLFQTTQKNILNNWIGCVQGWKAGMISFVS